MSRKNIVGAFALLIALVLVWMFSSLTPQNTGATVIEVTDLGFVPGDISIAQGETIVFKNTGSLTHWPASNFHPTHSVYPGSDARLCGSLEEPFLFDACRPLEPGEKYSFTFFVAGDWKFHDHLRPRYSGRIVVSEVSGYRTPLTHSLRRAFAETAQRITGFFFEATRIIPGLSLIHPDASGLLVGTKISEQELASSKDYETESVYHYVYDDVEIRKVVNQLGVRRTMEKILKESNNGSTFDCHIGAHYVGRASYDLFGEKAFSECTPGCHSGCYHGTMEALFWDAGPSTVSRVKNLCNSFDDEFSRQQCFHGAGHGLLALSEYDLPEAIKTCDEAGGDEKKTSCYGGVFMENVMTAVGLSAGIDAHTTEWLSFDDLQFPCNILGGNKEAQKVCYEMQTSWMLAVLSFDYEKVISLCTQVPSGMQDACFTSIGRDVGGTTLRNAEKTETLCAMVPSEYFPTCIIGTVNTVIDFWGPNLEDESIAFCEAFQRGDARDICYSRMVERAPDLFNDRDRRGTFCALLPEHYRDRCSVSIR